jgi:hypothetical protein
VRDYVVEQIGDPSGVLVADETGFVKKGRASAGVQRQYSGTTGKTEKCQIGTFLCYATVKGRVLIDRELYLPKSWTGDRDRCRRAAVPDEVEFATKPRVASCEVSRCSFTQLIANAASVALPFTTASGSPPSKSNVSSSSLSPRPCRTSATGCLGRVLYRLE